MPCKETVTSALSSMRFTKKVGHFPLLIVIDEHMIHTGTVSNVLHA